MRIGYFIMILCVALWVIPAGAQETISQQVEVMREYSPDVARADKLEIEPYTADTLSLRPEINYSITPTLWSGIFETSPVRPVRINTTEYRGAWPFYLRAGGGLPGMSLIDIYAATNIGKDGSAGAYINHYGEWAKLENDLGEKLPAGDMYNGAGGYFNKRLGGRNLDISVDFDNRSVRPFGAFAIERLPLATYRPENMGRLVYNDISASASFGDLFMDFSHLNWRLGIGGGYFSDNSGHGQANFSFEGGLGVGIGKDKFIINAGAIVREGKEKLSDYSSTVISLAPKYEFRNGKFNLAIGVELDYDISRGLNGVVPDGIADNPANTSEDDASGSGAAYNSSELKIFPDISLSYIISDLVSFHAALDGGIGNGSYSALSSINPYLTGGSWLRNSSRTGIRAGLSGVLFKRLRYDISGGADSYENYHCFANIYMDGNTTRFMPISGVNTTIFYLGAEFKAILLPELDMDISGKVYGVGKIGSAIWPYDAEQGFSPEGIATGVPQYEIDANVRYSYRDILLVHLGCGFTGVRDVSSAIIGSAVRSNGFHIETIPEAVNLKAGLEVRLTERMNVFLEAENLLNRKIYRFNHYPMMGVNVLGGVKIVF